MLSKTPLDRDIREAGFVDVAPPGVGAIAMIAFMVAREGPDVAIAEDGRAR